MIHESVINAVRGSHEAAHVKLADRLACSDQVTDLHRLAALVEEVGEVSRLLEPGTDVYLPALYGELVDVANVAMSWASYLLETREPQ